MPPVKFDYAVICDDIRREDSGKLILIGVYTGDLLFSNFPANFLLATYFHGSAYELGEFDIEVRYLNKAKDQDKANELTAEGVINVVDTNQEVVVPLPRMPIAFLGPGTLKVDYRINGGRWKTLAEKRVGHLNGPSTELEQPS